ncbi:MAG: DNA replication/repair protein RecF, partial [Alphaproteobacteria bacterium]
MELTKTGVRHIRLTGFRSYESLDLSLGEDLSPVVLTGHNGAGKTNVLEAVSFLTAGRGLRGARLSDVAKRNEADLQASDGDVIRLPARWSVSAQVQTVNGLVQLGTGTVDGSDRRQIRIDGRSVTKQAELGEVFRCLWLTPAQDRLFCGDPVSRRRFLDRLVQAFDPAHATRTSEYNAAFKQWSCLLREGRYDETWLGGLERQMAMNGVAIAASRLDIVSRVSAYLNAADADLFPSPEIRLTGVVEQALLHKAAVLVEEEFAAQLARGRKIYADGGSVAGPHTADFKVLHRQKNMDASLCSTGEQKALLISIILAQMKAQMSEQGLCP